MTAETSAASPAPSRAEEAITHVLDGQAVVFHERLGSVHVLDPIATVIWSLLDGRASIEELATDLAQSYGAERAVVLTDLHDVIRDLGRMGLLRGVGPDPSVVEAHRPSSPMWQEGPDG